MTDAAREAMKRKAAATVKMFSLGGYTVADLEKLDALFDAGTVQALAGADRSTYIDGIGSYLGEVIIATHGGEWSFSKTTHPRISHSAGGQLHFADPMGKVAKRFDLGPEERLSALVGLVGHVLQSGGAKVPAHLRSTSFTPTAVEKKRVRPGTVMKAGAGAFGLGFVLIFVNSHAAIIAVPALVLLAAGFLAIVGGFVWALLGGGQSKR